MHPFRLIRRILFPTFFVNYRISEILSYIETELSQPLSTDNLAERLGLSVSRFQHIFKTEVGTSVTKHIKEKRLQKARELLETTNLSIKEIRTQIGATDATNFIKDFGKKFETTPTEYRTNFRSSRKNQ